MTNFISKYEASKTKIFVCDHILGFKRCFDKFNPILSGLWNYVTERGGAIMARMDSSHPEAVSRHPKAQK